jgi:hypothetical protein
LVYTSFNMPPPDFSGPRVRKTSAASTMRRLARTRTTRA